jgi:hypothetical protein
MTLHWQSFLQGLVAVGFYAFAVWRLARANRGNKVLECARVSLLLVFVCGALSKLNVPNWLLESLGLLMLLMCFVTVWPLCSESVSRHT